MDKNIKCWICEEKPCEHIRLRCPFCEIVQTFTLQDVKYEVNKLDEVDDSFLECFFKCNNCDSEIHYKKGDLLLSEYLEKVKTTKK